MFMVSIMPCTAKKFEITRTDDMYSTGYKDVDVVLTTRELSRMIKSAGIDFRNLPDEEGRLDSGNVCRCRHIFGVTGGVMEAALAHGRDDDDRQETAQGRVRGCAWS
jgi:iron only hydrogenase large subunit-like protein